MVWGGEVNKMVGWWLEMGLHLEGVGKAYIWSVVVCEAVGVGWGVVEEIW